MSYCLKVSAEGQVKKKVLEPSKTTLSSDMNISVLIDRCEIKRTEMGKKMSAQTSKKKERHLRILMSSHQPK